MYLIKHHIWHPARQALLELPMQLRAHVKWYATVLLVMAALTAMVVHIYRNTHIIISELFTDPIEFGTLPHHVGTYSYMSATSLIVAGAFLLFAGWVVPNLDSAMRWFLLLFGAFVLWLGIDDVFMFHEWVGLRLAWLIESDDVPRDRQWLEAFVFASYAAAWIGFVVVFSRQILKTAWILLALTFAAFAMSVVLDLYHFIDFLPPPTTRTMRHAFGAAEDLFKLAGALFVLAYGIHTTASAVRGKLNPDIGTG